MFFVDRLERFFMVRKKGARAEIILVPSQLLLPMIWSQNLTITQTFCSCSRHCLTLGPPQAPILGNTTTIMRIAISSFPLLLLLSLLRVVQLHSGS